jgi:type III pantothenate kinase
MLLAIDIGNTSTQFALQEGDQWKASFRLATNPGAEEAELTWALGDNFTALGLRPSQVEALAISSVVPPFLAALLPVCARLFKPQPFVIDHSADLGLDLGAVNAAQTGTDRLVNAAEAHARFGASLVLDFGTATTFDLVDAEGRFLGGCICPGLVLGLEALHQHTANLPRVPLARPRRVIGTNTLEAMQAGVLLGYAALVEGLIARIKAEAGFPMRVLATGGLAQFVTPEAPSIEENLPNLTVDGIARIWRLRGPALREPHL